MNKGLAIGLTGLTLGICFGLLFGAVSMGLRVEKELPSAEYGIWTYDYNETIVFRYREHKVIYEYSYSGKHIVSFYESGEFAGNVTMDDQEEAVEFCQIYLEDLKREDGLR